MISKEYLLKLFSKALSSKNCIKIDKNIQEIYNKFGYGYNSENDAMLLGYLQQYNMQLEKPYLASGQSGYFTEQILQNGLGNFKLKEQDAEDAKFISGCFGNKNNYSNSQVPITYACVLGNVEFNYASQTFPAGIFEDVFQCSPTHELPIQPYVGEDEVGFYLRLLEYQISNSSNFDYTQKGQVMICAERIIRNFCKNKSVVYLIPIEEVLNTKAYFGDLEGLRDGKKSIEEAQNKIESLSTLEELLKSFSINIDSYGIYNDPNMTSEYGISLYDVIPTEKLHYIEVESRYHLIQKRALAEGYKVGDVIPTSFDIRNNKTL